MQSEKHINAAVLIYLLLLSILAIVNLVRKGNVLDVIYLVVIVCCVFKYFMIVHEDRK